MVQAGFQTQPKIDEKTDGSRDVPGGPRGPRDTPKIHQRSIVCEQKALHTWILCRFLRTRPLFMNFARFCIDFSRKNNEKSMNKIMHFFTSSPAFLNMATLTKHRILRCESYFFIFRALVFLSNKNHQKTTPKFKKQFFAQKSPKKGLRGRILEPKTVPNSRQRG